MASKKRIDTKNVKIDPKSTEFQELAAAIECTWQTIGYDMQECCELTNEPLSNEAAVEGCIDADRLGEFGGMPGADKTLDGYIDTYGYAAVLKFLSKHIPLV